jgi:hypothetical protein
MEFKFVIGHPSLIHYAEEICQLIAESAKARGTGIAKRPVQYIQDKISSGNAILALSQNQLVGFCYIETWEHGKYVANSGLIIHPDFRQMGLAKQVKTHIFQLSKTKYPNAQIFGITTSLAVMRINSSLGYQPVTFSELTQDEAFWKGCQSCPNYDILQRNQQKMCLCTAMLAPAEKVTPKLDLSHLILNQA